ncbi:MAG: DNA-binding response regulator, partial [Deltaproteobacteria bacterium]
KAGAVDFLEKPVENQTLLVAVRQALEKDRQARLAQARRQVLQERFAALTPRERQVFQMVAAGRLNKEIAFDLGTAERTIKVHRASLMRKLNCQSLAELVRLAQELESK